MIEGCNAGNSSMDIMTVGAAFPYVTRPYTRQHQSRAGGQGQYSSWAAAVTQI